MRKGELNIEFTVTNGSSYGEWYPRIKTVKIDKDVNAYEIRWWKFYIWIQNKFYRTAWKETL